MDRIYKEIKKLPYHLALYIYYRFPELKSQSEELTEEVFLERAGRKTMNAYDRFARSPQFKLIEGLILQERMSKNILKIYEETSERALGGDSRAISDLLKLKKTVDEMIKQAEKSKDEVEEDFEDDLI